MKILFVTLFLPQAKASHAGGRHVYEIIRNLSKKHETHLATRVEDSEIPHLESLKPFCKRIYAYPYKTKSKRSIFDVLKLILNYIGFSRYADNLSRSGNYDLIQVEWTEAGILLKRRTAPMVLDAHDVITKPAERVFSNSKGAARLLSYLKFRSIRALERMIVKKFDVVFTLSEYDKQYLLLMNPLFNVRVVPVPAGLDMTDRDFEKQRNTMLFLASYKYRRVNVDAALYFYRQVFPIVRRKVPDAKFIIAGYGPPEELLSLQEKDHDVLVTGFIEDTEEYYKTASVFVAPVLVGGGIIVKVLDAMAAGTPVVTTSYGNEGIGAVPGRDLLVADNPTDFAEAVITLLEHPEFAHEIAANGRGYVRKNYSPGAVMHRIESAYEELVKHHGSE